MAIALEAMTQQFMKAIANAEGFGRPGAVSTGRPGIPNEFDRKEWQW